MNNHYKVTTAIILASLIVISIVGCGGGGGGGDKGAAPSGGSTPSGIVDGYAYATLGTSRATSAQSSTVPLVDAVVSITGVPNTTTTDTNGYFKMQVVPTGEHTVTIYKAGYGTITKTANVSENNTFTVSQAIAFPSRETIPVSLLAPVEGTGWEEYMGVNDKHAIGQGWLHANDTYAKDLNLNSPNSDSDAGKPVFSVEKGIVVAADKRADGVGFVLIKHANGVWWSGYMHMSDIQVSESNNEIPANTLLGYVSNVGVPDGNNHLHFAVYTGSYPVDYGLTSYKVDLDFSRNSSGPTTPPPTTPPTTPPLTTPTYSYSYLGQEPALNGCPIKNDGIDEIYFRLTLSNPEGYTNWDSPGFHLGIVNKSGEYDPFESGDSPKCSIVRNTEDYLAANECNNWNPQDFGWINKNRPASIKSSNGRVSTFEFRFRTPQGLKPDKYRIYVRPVDDVYGQWLPKSDGDGMYFEFQVVDANTYSPPSFNGYSYDYCGQEPSANGWSINNNGSETKTLSLVLINKGSNEWPSGQFHLGIVNNEGKHSDFENETNPDCPIMKNKYTPYGACNDWNRVAGLNWISNNRPSGVTGNNIKPGETFSFKFNLNAPPNFAIGNNYRLYVNPVIDKSGGFWLLAKPGDGMYWEFCARSYTGATCQ